MFVDLSNVDEHSGELCRHTPIPNGKAPLCLLEIELNPRIINRAASDKHVLYFNAFMMTASTKKKEKVQIQFCKMGLDRIILPTEAKDTYTVVVMASDASHYATRIGVTFKLMLHMQDCTLCTFHRNVSRDGPQTIEEIHNSLFVTKEKCIAHHMQNISTAKITLANVGVERYREKFLVSVLFVHVPMSFQEQYLASRRSHGTTACN